MSVRKPQKDVNANQAFVPVLTFSYNIHGKVFIHTLKSLTFQMKTKYILMTKERRDEWNF